MEVYLGWSEPTELGLGVLELLVKLFLLHLELLVKSQQLRRNRLLLILYVGGVLLVLAEAHVHVLVVGALSLAVRHQ